jgi:DNA-binding SARP family transcriptional activator
MLYNHAVEYRLLGPFEVRGGRQELGLARKQKALLALLLLSANRVVTRERLIDELWGDEPPKRAAKAIQVYVSQLRKGLPPETLQTRPSGYLLAAAPDSVDLLRFEGLVEAAREAEPEQSAALLRKALGLWRGPALAEFSAEPFGRVEARRLEDRRLATLEERIEADLALGRHAELIGELEALIAAEPQRERLRAQLMLALYRAGRQAGALDAYRHARAALGELGLEPGPDLRRLEQRILRHDASLELPRHGLLAGRPGEPTPLPGALVPTPPFPFVGRSDELAELGALLDRAQRGEGAVVLLSGEAGAGKTRLIREVANRASAGGMLVCYGISDPAVGVPYQPLREWLAFLARTCDREAFVDCLEGDQTKLARLAPELDRLGGRAKTTPQQGEDDAYMLQSAATGLLARISHRQPLLLIADDLQWADSQTLELLRRLSNSAPEARVLVLAAYRQPGEEISPTLAHTLGELSRHDQLVRIQLGPLTAGDLSAFVRASADAEPSEQLLATLEELTDGTPVLLCELWRELSESGAVSVSGGQAELNTSIGDLQPSQRLRDIVRHRLARLAPGTASVLELAATAGPRFEMRTLAAATNEAASLPEALDEATTAGFLEHVPGPAGGYRFTHELLRRAVYDHVSARRRAELHLRIGKALELLHPNPVPVLPELAHHFTVAAPIAGAERAVAYNRQATDAAVAASAYAEAATWLATALQLGIADPHERARTQLVVSNLMGEAGQQVAAREWRAAAMEAAVTLGDRRLATHAVVRTIGDDLFSDPELDPLEVARGARDAIETFEELGDELGLAAAYRVLGLSLSHGGRTMEGLAESERSIVHAEASGDRAVIRICVTSLGGRLGAAPLPAGQALQRSEELLQRFGDDRVLEGVLTRFRALLLTMVGRFDEARDGLERSAAILDAINLLTPSWVYRAAAAEAKLLLGDTAGAEQELVSRFATLRTMRAEGPDGRAIQSQARLALVYCDEGRWDEATACLTYGAEVPELAFIRPSAIVRLAAQARLRAHDGDIDAGLRLARRAAELGRTTDLYDTTWLALLALAEVERQAGNDAIADAAVDETIRIHEAKGNVTAVAHLRALTERPERPRLRVASAR